MIKLKTSAIITSGVLVTTFASAYLFNGVAHGSWDFDGLNQQVQHLTEQADNHEARITNVENKVDAPADQPTPTPQVVTKVVTEQAPQAATGVSAPQVQADAPAPTVAPKTVTGVKHNLCKSTITGVTLKLVITDYSDGTTEWKTDAGEPFTGGCAGGLGGTW